jgi:hypothetical protein
VRAGDYGGRLVAGDIFGDIWGGIKKVAGAVIPAIASGVPIIGGVLSSTASKVLGSVPSKIAGPVSLPVPMPGGAMVNLTAPPKRSTGMKITPLNPGISDLIGQLQPGMATGMPRGSFGRGRRSMNYGNPKALRRSIRRLEGAEKQYARLLKVTTGCSHNVAHIKPKRKGRR